MVIEVKEVTSSVKSSTETATTKSQQNLKTRFVDVDKNLLPSEERKIRRSIKESGKRISRMIQEIHEYERREKDELVASIKSQAKELLFFFSLFVVYVLFGGFVFFYIEECSGAALANDGSTPSLVDKTINATFYDINKTCLDIYSAIHRNTTNISREGDIFHLNFLPHCLTKLQEAVKPFIEETAYLPICELNEFQLLKYAEYTIFTLLTVGYGNTTPVTIIGRYVLILYAIFGVPIAVSMYSVAGKLLVQIFTFVVYVWEKHVLKRRGEVKRLQAKVIGLSCVVMLLIMMLGCSVTMRKDMENWSFSSSLYFWFVSLTTIGYGDLHFNRLKHLKSIHFLMLSAGNLLFGLGISAAIIEAFAMALEKREDIINDESSDSDESDKEDANVDVVQKDPTVVIEDTFNKQDEVFTGGIMNEGFLNDDFDIPDTFNEQSESKEKIKTNAKVSFEQEGPCLRRKEENVVVYDFNESCELER